MKQNLLEQFLLKNVKNSYLNDEITTEKDNAIAVSLNKVPEIPFMKISGKNTATNIRVVAIIANVICFDPL